MPRKPSAFDQFYDETAPDAPTPGNATKAPKTAKARPSTRSRHMAESVGDLFDSIPSAILGATATSILVPNKFPSIHTDSYRIALIGEAPGEDEERIGEPFIGQSGRFLDQVLSKSGIARAACFIGNIVQHRPPNNDISLFSRSGPEFDQGLANLTTDLSSFNPNVCILFGKTALWAAKGTDKISDWRGSFFVGDIAGPFLGRKCISTYHPAFCLRMYENTPMVMFDVGKAVKEAHTSDLVLPTRSLVVNLSHSELRNKLDQLILEKPALSIDIEGGVSSMSCISMAVSPADSFIVPFERMDGSSYWALAEQEEQIWEKLIAILSDPLIPKVLQNGLYDRFVLLYSYSIVVKGMVDDTMLKHWELYCELEKALGVQVSIYCGNEPYYKFERKSDDEETYFKYCCKDSAVTMEISQKLDRYLDVRQKEHYHMNVELLNPLLYMEQKGIRYNYPLAKERLVAMKDSVYGYQEKLDTIAREACQIIGINFNTSHTDILSQVNSICCYKKDPAKPKKPFEEKGYWDVYNMLQAGNSLSLEDKGQISVLCKATMNTKSSKFKDFLYGHCGLPVQYKKDPKTKEMRPTTDYKSLLKLSKSHPHPVLNLALELSRLRTRQQMLAILPIHGRMHCSYNLVGSETARVTSSKSVIYVFKKKVGGNMQTIPDDWQLEDEEHPLTQGMRDLFLADEGCYLIKCDLKGSDGWTIGAYMAMLGDSTMLDDLKFGLKPAQIVAYILKHGSASIRNKTRPELKEMLKEIQKEDWQYFVSKQLIWGTAYTLGPRKAAELVFVESEGKINLSESEARDFQRAIYVRYNFETWHSWMTNFASTQVYPARFQAPNGFTRKFFSRNFGKKIECLGEMLAHMPQVITTATTLTAAHRLWTDPTNRNGNYLKVEPMHQVHDELVSQCRIELIDWAIPKMKEWFHVPIIVAGQKITIPFTGSWGTSWAMDKNSKVGDFE